MSFQENELHVRGESQFVDDFTLPEGTLFAYPAVSTISRGRIESIDIEQAKALPGIIDVLTYSDIPGENYIGNVEAAETLLAEQDIVYQGQPVAIVIAETDTIALRAAKQLKINTTSLTPLLDVHEADRQGCYLAPPRTFCIGDVDKAWQQCDVIVEGRADSGAQQHVYLETQAALALPLENEGLKVYSATQSPGMVQRIISRVLGCAMHNLEIDVLRLGGGFGGKEEQATPWASMVALAAKHTQKPVKMVLQRMDDMAWTGNRHPYSSSFKIGLSTEGKILAYQVRLLQNAGAVADLSPAILERTLFHCSNGYFIPNVEATGISCRTNLPPNTAFRGFGAPQAMFVLEAAIFKAARRMNLDPAVIQQQNLIHEGDCFPYAMRAERCLAQRSWQQLHDNFNLKQQRQCVEQFNAEHDLQKKAVAVMPICFGISFTAKFLNQAEALVHIYGDGSVSISCGAVEMGQGVKEKIRSIAARVFSIDQRRIKVQTTNTGRIANMSPTAASTGADLNGQATDIACKQLLASLKNVAAASLQESNPENIAIIDEQVYCHGKPTELDWCQLISRSYIGRKQLSALAHYATPKLEFDTARNQGHPFAYHVYGCAAVEVTVDCLRGIYHFNNIKIVHDCGASLNPQIDRGQIEGAVVQGLGWMTLEEVIFDPQGKLLTDTLTGYKIPDIHFAPDIQVEFLADSCNPPGLYHSKAVGEPPFMYGIAGYFALTKAILEFNPRWQPDFTAPMTPERVLTALYQA